MSFRIPLRYTPERDSNLSTFHTNIILVYKANHGWLCKFHTRRKLKCWISVR